MLVDWSSNWIKIVDKLNNIVIDDFDYEYGIHGQVTTKHCVKCIAVNQCWFVDEKDKKPEPMEYSVGQILSDINDNLGLYHYNCHCKEIRIAQPKEADIKLIIPKGKEDWLFLDKSEWIRAMGYEPNEKFLDYLKKKIVESYCLGKYKIRNIDKFGVRITLYVDIEGYGIKSNHIYRLKSGFSIFSNGRLKCNTFIGGKV